MTWPKNVIRVTRRHDLTKKDLPTYLPTYDYNTDNWEPGFVTWQLIVTLDRIRNSCDVSKHMLEFSITDFFYFIIDHSSTHNVGCRLHDEFQSWRATSSSFSSSNCSTPAFCSSCLLLILLLSSFSVLIPLIAKVSLSHPPPLRPWCWSHSYFKYLTFYLFRRPDLFSAHNHK